MFFIFLETCQYEYGVDYTLNDLDKIPNWPARAQCADECQQMCASIEDCTHFTFNKATNRCYPKHGVIAGRTDFADAVSGEKICKMR